MIDIERLALSLYYTLLELLFGKAADSIGPGALTLVLLASAAAVAWASYRRADKRYREATDPHMVRRWEALRAVNPPCVFAIGWLIAMTAASDQATVRVYGDMFPPEKPGGGYMSWDVNYFFAKARLLCILHN